MFAERQGGRPPPAPAAEPGVADGIYAPVDGVEAPGGDPPSDAWAGQAGGEQLSDVGNAVLTRRDSRDQRIRPAPTPDNVSHTETKPGAVMLAPGLAGLAVPIPATPGPNQS